MRFYISMNNLRHSSRALTLLLVLFLVSLAAAAPAAKPGKYLFYVGTYTEEGSTSKGIYVYRFDSGRLAPMGPSARDGQIGRAHV